MNDIQSIIDSIPVIRRKGYSENTPEFYVQSDMSTLLKMIKMELNTLNQYALSESDSSRGVIEALSIIDETLSKIDTVSIFSEIKKMREEFKIEIPAPIVKASDVTVNVPTDELISILEAIKSLKLDSVKVNNISEITKVINDLKPLLVNIESTISDISRESIGNQEVYLNKDTLKILDNLKYLNTTAEKPIAVRLTDGKVFYKLINSVNEGVRLMTGSSGNNFLDSNGNPTKARLDQNNNLIVSNIVSSGRIVDENGYERIIQRAFLNASSSGDNEIIPAQGSGIKIRVFGYSVVCGSAVTIKFRSGSTDISAGFPFAANTGISVPFDPNGPIQTSSNEALNINLSGAVTVGINITWCQVS